MSPSFGKKYGTGPTNMNEATVRAAWHCPLEIELEVRAFFWKVFAYFPAVANRALKKMSSKGNV